jgi:hydroxymethylbilane synthase
VPIGAHATVANGRLRLIGVVASPDGGEQIRGEVEGAVSEADALGRRLGADLLARGGRRILDEVYGAAPEAPAAP